MLIWYMNFNQQQEVSLSTWVIWIFSWTSKLVGIFKQTWLMLSLPCAWSYWTKSLSFHMIFWVVLVLVTHFNYFVGDLPHKAPGISKYWRRKTWKSKSRNNFHTRWSSSSNWYEPSILSFFFSIFPFHQLYRVNITLWYHSNESVLAG